MVEKWCRSVSYTRKRLSRTGNVFSSHLAMRYRLFTALSSICLVDRYEETPVLQKSIWINNPQILQCSRLNICFYNFIMFTLNPANIVDCTTNPTNLKKHFKHIIIHVRYLRN